MEVEEQSLRAEGESLHVRAARWIVALAGGLVFLAGALAYCGWFFHQPAWRDPLAGPSEIKFNAAICIIFAGLSLLLGRPLTSHPWEQRLARVFAAVPVIIGLLTLFEFLGVNLHIDELFFLDPDRSAAGRMSRQAAFSYLFAGLALLLLDDSSPRRIRLSQACAALTAFFPAQVLVAALYGTVLNLAFWPYRGLSELSFSASMALLVLSVGIFLARPDSGFVRFLFAPAPASLLDERVFQRLLRRVAFWPVAVLFGLMLLLVGLLNYLLSSAQSVDHTHSVLGQIARVEELAVDMETGLRGFQATGERTFLEPFDRARDALPRELSALQLLVRDSPVQLVHVSEVRAAHRDWMAFANDAATHTGIRDILDVPLQLRGKALMDTLRRRLDAMQDYENQLLVMRSRTLARVRTVVVSSVLLSGVIMAPLLTLSVRRMLVRMNTSYRAALGEAEGSREKLQEANARLRDQAHQLEEIVAQRTAALRDSVQQLETFSYSIVHDMRAPLRSMRSFASFLEQEYHDKLDEQARDYLTRIVSSSSRLDALITDVLKYSSITMSPAELARVNLDKLASDIIEQYPQFQEAAARIHIEHPLPPVLGNTALLTQVLSNLIGNALKFVPPEREPRVTIRAENGGGHVRLWVEDNGIGIEPQYQQKIFGLFQRLHRPDQFSGTGVGLAIVQKAAERMSGKAGVESEPGQGSRFWVELSSLDPK